MYTQLLKERYLSWSVTEMGTKIMNGTTTLEECAQYALQQPSEPNVQSGQQELYEIIRNTEIYYRRR